MWLSIWRRSNLFHTGPDGLLLPSSARVVLFLRAQWSRRHPNVSGHQSRERWPDSYQTVESMWMKKRTLRPMISHKRVINVQGKAALHQKPNTAPLLLFCFYHFCSWNRTVKSRSSVPDPWIAGLTPHSWHHFDSISTLRAWTASYQHRLDEPTRNVSRRASDGARLAREY